MAFNQNFEKHSLDERDWKFSMREEYGKRGTVRPNAEMQVVLKMIIDKLKHNSIHGLASPVTIKAKVSHAFSDGSSGVPDREPFFDGGPSSSVRPSAARTRAPPRLRSSPVTPRRHSGTSLPILR